MASLRPVSGAPSSDRTHVHTLGHPPQPAGREAAGGGGRRREEAGGGGRRREEAGGGGRRREEAGGGGRRWEEAGGGGGRRRREEAGGGGRRRRRESGRLYVEIDTPSEMSTVLMRANKD